MLYMVHSTEYLQFSYLKRPLILGKHYEFRTSIYESQLVPCRIQSLGLHLPSRLKLLLIFMAPPNIMGVINWFAAPFRCSGYHQVTIRNMIIHLSQWIWMDFPPIFRTRLPIFLPHAPGWTRQVSAARDSTGIFGAQGCRWGAHWHPSRARALGHPHQTVLLLQGTDQEPRFGKFDMEGFHQWGYPKNDCFLMENKIPFKWMMWGYPYFSKPPYVSGRKIHVQFNSSLKMLIFSHIFSTSLGKSEIYSDILNSVSRDHA